MSKYCKQCGSPLEENEIFCPNCGSQVNVQPVVLPVKRNRSVKVMVGVSVACVLLVAAVVAIVLVAKSVGGGYKQAVDDYFTAIETHDAELMRDVTSDYWVEYRLADYDTDEYLMEDFEDIIDEAVYDFDCGEDIKIDYEIQSKTRATQSDLEDLEEDIYDNFAYYVYEEGELKITDAYVLDIELSIEGEEGSDTFYFPEGFLVIKENGDWTVPRGLIDTDFYSNY